jgi:hypothetical protein
VLLAEAINRLRTNASIVAISATLILMTSFESALNWLSDNARLTNMAANALPNTNTNITKPIVMDFTLFLRLQFSVGRLARGLCFDHIAIRIDGPLAGWWRGQAACAIGD